MSARSIALSIRREVWENKSIYIAPLIVAGVIIFGALVATLAGRHGMGATLPSDPNKLADPYNVAALMLMGTTLLVAIFYCLDALYGERRDRSVLFWKSMPVSDWTTVLSKAAVPIVVLPLVTFAITIATQLVALLLSTGYLLVNGRSPAVLWQLPWPRMSFMLLYHLVAVHGLYYAPIFAWLLLVSAWAKRLPILWASLPVAAIAIVEKIVFNTTRFGALLGSRIAGGEDPNMPQKGGVMMLGDFDPLHFFSSPGLWIGFALAALFLFGAVQLRRYRDPI